MVAELADDDDDDVDEEDEELQQRSLSKQEQLFQRCVSRCPRQVSGRDRSPRGLATQPTCLPPPLSSLAGARTQQVLRYDYGGCPLWCTLPAPEDARDIPVCESCGDVRLFEFQIMPGLLQLNLGPDVLVNYNVEDSQHQQFEARDSNSTGNVTGSRADGDSLGSRSGEESLSLSSVLKGGKEDSQEGGRSAGPSPLLPATVDIDFGVVVIYSCASSCAGGSAEYVVVQPPSDSTDVARLGDRYR